MLCETNNSQVLWVIDIEKINGYFDYACEHEDIAELQRICSCKEKFFLSDETITLCARSAVRQDKLQTLKFIFANFPNKLDIEDFLETSVSHDAQKCFNFLIIEKGADITSMKYSMMYNRAVTMKKKLQSASLTLHI